MEKNPEDLALAPMPLLNLLARYAQRGGERWHTPGHKGKVPPGGDFLTWEHDITEIEEILLSPNVIEQSEALMAQSYGADRTWYSVAGATLPVMAAILAAFPMGSTLYLDRNMHRCALSALVIGGYQVRWLYPSAVKAGVPLPLQKFPQDYAGAEGLVVTRPTYDGLAAPLQSAIDNAHAQGLKVVVDEAHGSHWQGPDYPGSAIGMGADLTAHGVHKSEASLTQTGLLHLTGARVSSLEVDRWWNLLQTSSPSYLLLGSLDRLQWERRQSKTHQAWQKLAQEAQELWTRLEQQGTPVLQLWAKAQGFAVDPARLTLLGNGAALRQRLSRYGEVEKVTPGSCTLFLAPYQDFSSIPSAVAGLSPADGELTPYAYPVLPTVLSARDAWQRLGHRVPLREASGRVVKEALTPYPPGIPVAVPGEALTDEMLEWIAQWAGTVSTPIHGIHYQEGRPTVWVIDE